MPQVHAIAARPAAGVEEERLALLVPVEDPVELAVREEHAPAEEDVRAVAREPFEPLEQRSVDTPRAELVDELVVVDRELLPIRRDRALDIPRSNDLRLCAVRRGLDRGRVDLFWVWRDDGCSLSWFGGHGSKDGGNYDANRCDSEEEETSEVDCGLCMCMIIRNFVILFRSSLLPFAAGLSRAAISPCSVGGTGQTGQNLTDQLDPDHLVRPV